MYQLWVTAEWTALLSPVSLPHRTGKLPNFHTPNRASKQGVVWRVEYNQAGSQPWLKEDLIPVNVSALMNTLWEDLSICSGSPSPTAPTQNAFGNCQDPPATVASASLWSWWPGWWSPCSFSYSGLLTWEAPAFLESPPVLTVDRTHQPLLWTNILVWEAVIDTLHDRTTEDDQALTVFSFSICRLDGIVFMSL